MIRRGKNKQRDTTETAQANGMASLCTEYPRSLCATCQYTAKFWILRNADRLVELRLYVLDALGDQLLGHGTLGGLRQNPFGRCNRRFGCGVTDIG